MSAIYIYIYIERTINLLIKLISDQEQSILKSTTFDQDTLTGNVYEKGERRVGPPRSNWLKTTLEEYWNLIKTNLEYPETYQAWDPNKENHRQLIKYTAKINHPKQIWKDKPTSEPSPQEVTIYNRKFQTWLSTNMWLV